MAAALVAEGAEHLPYKINRRGLSVRVIGECRVPAARVDAPIAAQAVSEL